MPVTAHDAAIVWIAMVAIGVVLAGVGRQFSRRTTHVVTVLVVLLVLLLVTIWEATRQQGFSEALAKGARHVTEAFFLPFFVVTGREPSADGAALVTMAVLLAAAVWVLEVWTVRFEPPTVEVAEPDPGASDREKRIVREVQFRLPAVEVHRPALLPGGSRAEALAAVVEKADEAHGAFMGALVRFVGKVWPSPHAYLIKIYEEDVQPAQPAGVAARLPWRLQPAPTAGSTPTRPTTGPPRDPYVRITVDVRHARTGQSHVVRTLVAPETQLAEHVAGFSARTAFRTDWTAPRWAVGSFDGQDLAAYLIHLKSVQPLRSPADAQKLVREQIALLQHATRNSPGAGVVRYELALLHDLVGDQMDALALHAHNVRQFPAFYRASYRLAMSLEMVAGSGFEDRWNGYEDDRASLVRDLLACGLRDANGAPAKLDSGVGKAMRSTIKADESAPVRRALLALAERHLKQYRHALRIPFLLTRSFLHRDERAGWSPYLFEHHLARPARLRLRESTRVALALVRIRQLLLEVEESPARAATVVRDLNRILRKLDPERYPRTGRSWTGRSRVPSWSAVYNAACVYAVMFCAQQSHPIPGLPSIDLLDAKAVELLAWVIDDPDCEFERPYDWISKDPDLARLLEASTVAARFLQRQKHRDYPEPLPGET